jgi:hypothetical protein
MSDTHSRLAALGIGIPEILLPKEGTDLYKWAVIACDQFTQDRNYWEKVKETVGSSPSCLNMIFPEAYLEDGGEEGKNRRIRDIRNCMASYAKEGLFTPTRCCVYVERSTNHHPKRSGLVLLFDLEQYDWDPESRLLIRSTEGTLQERLPPRMAIRRGAPLELPHILLLINDEGDSLIPSLGKIARERPPMYETPLMMNSGAVRGWALDTEQAWAVLADGLESLAEKPPGSKESPFLIAVGDGNHSLATAKAVWEEYKKAHAGEAGLENHPARWALAELENLYDPGLSFEPIHRIIFNAGQKELLDALSSLKDIRSLSEAPGIIRIEGLSPDIVTVSLQPLLDNFVKEKGCAIDYIHGEDELLRLASSRRAVGLILPPVRKDGLFKTVAQTGPLPRKSFSMGEAEEKRFYLECRKLFGYLQ